MWHLFGALFLAAGSTKIVCELVMRMSELVMAGKQLACGYQHPNQHSIACRILKAVKERLVNTAAEREAKRNIKVEGAGNVPKTMQVKQSPVSANGNGQE